MNTTKSEQIKRGLHKSFQNGASKKAQTVCYGYTQNSDGTLIVQSEQASVVRAIFDGYLGWLQLGQDRCQVTTAGCSFSHRKAQVEQPGD